LERTELWSDDAFAGGDRRFPVAATGGENDLYTLHERFAEPCAVLHVRNGRAERVFAAAGLADAGVGCLRYDHVGWEGVDGCELNGLLAIPNGGPRGLVVWLHGGPVSVSTDQWAARPSAMAYLLAQGFAVFRPNPRGSVGTGRNSVSALMGDLGGTDADDVVAGVRHILAMGLVRPAAVGVAGESYGGFLSAWLVTQSSLFAAAAVISPITDWRTFRRDSNIAKFAELFVGGLHDTTRSPVRFANRVTTPTLTIVGGLDRCTPPGEGRQWHDALRRHRRAPVKLVEYATVAHIPRDFPELISYHQEISDWFTRHLRRS
jgi:dipeptidyl aminopeptidase/acylaminoacyl peptidase